MRLGQNCCCKAVPLRFCLLHNTALDVFLSQTEIDITQIREASLALFEVKDLCLAGKICFAIIRYLKKV